MTIIIRYRGNASKTAKAAKCLAATVFLFIFWSVARDDIYSDYSLLEYQPLRRLEFVHIARTGGKAIAHEAYDHGIHWGVCHFRDTQECPMVRNAFTDLTAKYHNCPWEHVPSQYFDILLPTEKNPYHEADRFTVVRNVYDRLISEFYGEQHSESMFTVAHLNEWVRRVLLTLRQSKQGDLSRKEVGNEEYFTRLGHLIPQYDYVYENGKQVIQHVLRYETLHKDFEKLMEQYDLPLRLPPRPNEQPQRELTAYNLTKVNLVGIEVLYEKDFREWGYERLSTKLSDQQFALTLAEIAREKNVYLDEDVLGDTIEYKGFSKLRGKS